MSSASVTMQPEIASMFGGTDADEAANAVSPPRPIRNAVTMCASTDEGGRRPLSAASERRPSGPVTRPRCGRLPARLPSTESGARQTSSRRERAEAVHP